MGLPRSPHSSNFASSSPSSAPSRADCIQNLHHSRVIRTMSLKPHYHSCSPDVISTSLTTLQKSEAHSTQLLKSQNCIKPSSSPAPRPPINPRRFTSTPRINQPYKVFFAMRFSILFCITALVAAVAASPGDGWGTTVNKRGELISRQDVRSTQQILQDDA